MKRIQKLLLGRAAGTIAAEPSRSFKSTNGPPADRHALHKKSAREMEQIVDVAASLGNALHDHIIVGRHASLKGLKLI